VIVRPLLFGLAYYKTCNVIHKTQNHEIY